MHLIIDVVKQISVNVLPLQCDVVPLLVSPEP